MEVRCYVDSCTYWESNLCQAATIEVNSQDAEKAPKRSDHTMCTTFKSRS